MYLADLIFGSALAFVIGCNIYFGPRLTSDRIAMQWNLNGRAIGMPQSGSRFGVWRLLWLPCGF
jgi:hypothetical protein